MFMPYTKFKKLVVFVTFLGTALGYHETYRTVNENDGGFGN
jgi:hypothetical protein